MSTFFTVFFFFFWLAWYKQVLKDILVNVLLLFFIFSFLINNEMKWNENEYEEYRWERMNVVLNMMYGDAPNFYFLRNLELELGFSLWFGNISRLHTALGSMG